MVTNSRSRVQIFYPTNTYLGQKRSAFRQRRLFASISSQDYENFNQKVVCGHAQNVHFFCFPGKWPRLSLWWSCGKNLSLPCLPFSKIRWHSPCSTIALSSNPLVQRQRYKATFGRQKRTTQVPPWLCGQNRTESFQRMEKPHELRLPKWSRVSQTIWNQQA